MSKHGLSRRACLTGMTATVALVGGLPTAVKAQSSKKATLRLNWIPNAEHAPYFVGKKKGFYSEAGVDLEILPGSGSANAVKFVGSRNDMFGVSLSDSVVIGRGREVPVVSTGVLLQQHPHIIVSLAVKNIKTAKDLEGKRVGVEARSSSGAFFQAFAQTANLDVSKVQQIELGTTAPVSAILGDVVDASILLATNEKVVMEAEGADVNIIEMGEYGVKAYGQCLFTSAGLAEEDPDLVTRVSEATFRSWEYCIGHIEEAVAVLKENVPETDIALETAKWDEIVPRTKPAESDAPFGSQSVEGWTSTYATFSRAGLIDTEYDPAVLIAKLY